MAALYECFLRFKLFNILCFYVTKTLNYSISSGKWVKLKRHIMCYWQHRHTTVHTADIHLKVEVGEIQKI